MRIGFAGLGSMGAPMARNLARKGLEPLVYNRTRAKAEALEKEGARVAASLRELGSSVDCAITMLSDDAALEATVLGQDGLLEALPRGAVHVSMSTISAELSGRLTELHARKGQGFVSAPVFGRPAAAEGAQLWIVAGGAPELVERCRPALQAMGQGILSAGPDPVSANVIKIAGNFLIASALEAMGEASALVSKAGLDAGSFLRMLNDSLIRSPLYATYGGLIAEKRYSPAGFQLKLGLKDARLALQAADRFAVPMPLASLIHDHLLSAVARGEGELDWSALAEVSARNAGLSR